MRRRLGPGLVVGLAFGASILLLFSACGDPSPSGQPRRDSRGELRRSLGIGPDVEIHRITLGGQGAREHVVPPRLEIEAGSVVEFFTVDGRVHTVRFPPDSLTTAAREFLRRTEQLESPPLVERGSRFVLTFEGAPFGRYPFVSDGNGGSTWGVVVVSGPG